MITKKCEWCEKVMIVTKNRIKLCSNECKNQAAKRYRRGSINIGGKFNKRFDDKTDLKNIMSKFNYVPFLIVKFDEI
jgi:hypothetical protein